MSSRYETITNLGEKSFLNLINSGMIPVHILAWKVHYESYLEYSKHYKSSEAINIVAANYKVSRRKVERIIQYMKGAK